MLAVRNVSVLFSEPKIPQRRPAWCCWSIETRFSALQRAENSSTWRCSLTATPFPSFQCSSASRKFLNYRNRQIADARRRVSVLFSEPKIPQPVTPTSSSPTATPFQCSSASRKFLNQPAPRSAPNHRRRVSVLFSEPKIPQLYAGRGRYRRRSGSFSALQRAENSSTRGLRRVCWNRPAFQCSSASRKFLNGAFLRSTISRPCGFSALQRAENSSTRAPLYACARHAAAVSVLFSEPKIPQPDRCGGLGSITDRFSALQRAENSSTLVCGRCRCLVHACFSALQRAENSSTDRDP